VSAEPKPDIRDPAPEPAEAPARRGVWRPGATVGPYRLLERIGAGTMGEVFRAEHVEHGTRYAIKTLSLKSRRERLDRMRREGEAQARSDGHINLVRVHDMGEALGRLYLVMELAEGGDLEERLRRVELDPLDAARLVAALARGLSHMHDAGVLHRDLKPGNVVFDAGGTPKLTDFGLARVEGADALTRDGDMIGTPIYMAPEQARGDRERVGERSDVYGLGAILYRLLTGEVPFGGETTLEVVTKLRRDPPRRPTALRPGLPLELEAICLGCLAKDPDARPDAEGLAVALEAFLEGAAGDAAPASPVRRPWALAALGGLGVGLLVLSGLAIGLGWVDPPADAADAADADPNAAPASGAPAPSARRQPPAAAAPAPAAEAEAEADAGAERPPAWAWPVGRRLRYRVEHAVEVALAGQTTVLSRRSFLLVCDATAAGDDGVTVEARLAGLGVRSAKAFSGGGWHRLDYDSLASDGARPLDRAIGGRFDLVLDPGDGAVARVTGTGALQRAVDGDLAGPERRSVVVPELNDPEVMRRGLDVFFRVGAAPAAEAPRVVSRPPPFVPRWGTAAAIAEGLPTLEATVTRRASTVHWRGAAEARWEATVGGQLRPRRIEVRLERSAHGESTVEGGVVTAGSYRERWTGTVRERHLVREVEARATGSIALIAGLGGR